MSEQESFWGAKSFAVITDKTKPAMKFTIEELSSRGKKVYVVELSEKPDTGALRSISELPAGVDCAVIGLTKINPANAISELQRKGVKKYWIHWRTETPEAVAKCKELQLQCVIGRCPMMYLAQGISIHTMHRGVAKLFGKY